MKVLGKRSAGKPHAAFDVAGSGNGKLEFTAPVLDPTLGGFGQSDLAVLLNQDPDNSVGIQL